MIKKVLSLAPPNFIKFGNYQYLFTSPDFFNSMRATFVFTMGTFVPIVVFSLLIATFLSLLSSKKAQGFFQIAFYTPAVISSVVAATIWLLIFDPRGIREPSRKLSHLPKWS